MSRSQVKHENRWSPLLSPDDPATGRDYTIRTRLWRHKGAGGWHFANLSTKQSAQIKSRFGATAQGWGSIRVRVRIGETEWSTSLFPDKKSKSYLFAIKAEVRKAENLADGDRITALIRIA